MMAESSGDAIPIQNYQEDVVVVPIDVHQRHNCQVSQIFDPDKASKIAEAQPNNVKPKKSRAEYFREYRARKKIRLQSTSGTSSIIRKEDIKTTRKKNKTEYMRKYRARKKISIQSTSDTSPIVIKEDGILHADNDSNDPNEAVGLPCQDMDSVRRKILNQYTREYRARKKNLNQSTSDPLVISQQGNDISQDSDDSNNVHKVVDLPYSDWKVACRKIRAEYMRGYRARKKIHVQSTSDTSSVVHHRGDDISFQTHDNSSNANELVKLSDQEINAIRQKRATERTQEHISVNLEPAQESQNQAPYLDESENATSLFNSDFHRHQLAHKEIKMEFVENPFSSVCSVCDGLCYKYDLQPPSSEHEDILKIIVPHVDKDDILICNTCRQSLNKKNIRTMAVYNGLEFPRKPEHLPSVDLVSERLITPQIPFMRIRRLRHVSMSFMVK
ncbi:uncharacterized protein LOC103577706 isoform X2 [Microplitis demolitor]|uniref:uncharacterized protein LOC103577706 isoform X2 n=1 Tax=Microplitis demolitor TaxID=69319 RepID=UPI0006D4FF2A|nr:uncharacterized protein LOC103577706 isoform X2 [Microplitis demolitor]